MAKVIILTAMVVLMLINISKIKLNRVVKLSPFSKFPNKFGSMVNDIPKAIWERCTALEIVEILNAMGKSYDVGFKRGYEESIQ